MAENRANTKMMKQKIHNVEMKTLRMKGLTLKDQKTSKRMRQEYVNGWIKELEQTRRSKNEKVCKNNKICCRNKIYYRSAGR